MKLIVPPGTPKLLLLSAVACAALSLIILMDFALPTKPAKDVVVTQVVNFNRGTKGGAGYHAYTTQCRQRSFPSDAWFAAYVPQGDTLTLGISPLLSQVSWYTSPTLISGERQTSSGRYASGFLLPLLMIGFCLAAFKINDLWFVGILIAVQILTVINFISLLS
jgi:hypothetical protein